jgi:CubicO group peptidase (beta-lactamase class C family)
MDSTFWQDCEAAAATWDVPAFAVGSLVEGRRDRRGFGCTVATRFRIASITKPFTATAAVRQLSLAAAVPGWPGVSVADALAHLGGYDGEHGDLSRFGDGDDALARLAAELPAVHRWLPAGEVWSYANTGYWLAGRLLAESAGRPYEEVIAKLASEAGLRETTFGSPDLEGTGPEVISGPYPRARRPSGGLVSTVDDLLQFGGWHLEQPELSAMRSARGKTVRGVYGLGFFGEQIGGVEVWSHAGSYGGFQSSFVLVPSRQAVLVGLTNSSYGTQALRLVEASWFDEVIGASRVAATTVDLSGDDLTAFAGAYANSASRFSVRVEGGGLVVSAQPGLEWAARAIGPRTFEIAEGAGVGDRFDFPRPGFARFGGRLAGLGFG